MLESKQATFIPENEEEAREFKKVQKQLKKIEEEMKALNLPTQFSSTKGQYIEGQIISEAKRTGMIRKYQQFQRLKLKKWQLKKIKGSKVKQKKNQAKVQF